MGKNEYGQLGRCAINCKEDLNKINFNEKIIKIFADNLCYGSFFLTGN
jgi:hypothetical protein